MTQPDKDEGMFREARRAGMCLSEPERVIARHYFMAGLAAERKRIEGYPMAWVMFNKNGPIMWGISENRDEAMFGCGFTEDKMGSGESCRQVYLVPRDVTGEEGVKE